MRRTTSLEHSQQQQHDGTGKPALCALKKMEAPMPRPEFYALPKIGGDLYFNLTRSWYYAAEKAGLLKLVRIRHRGKLRGVTRVAYDDVAKLFQEARK